MNHYIGLLIVGGLLILQSMALAQVPMLDSSTTMMPKSKALNKCIDENNRIIYTQFECAETATKADEKWVDQTNITFSTPDQKAVLPNGQLNPQLDPNQSGVDMLKNSMKDKSLIELFDQGIKTLMMRQDALDSL